MEMGETNDSIEYVLEGLLRSRHGDGGNLTVVHAPIETSASPEEGGPSHPRVSAYQGARFARCNHQARDSNGRRWSVDDPSPELGRAGAVLQTPTAYPFLGETLIAYELGL